MAAGYDILPAYGLVLARAWDVLTSTELIAATNRIGSDPRFHPDLRQLVDFRDATDVQLDAQGVRQLAALQLFAPDARRAFVMSTDVAYGMGRMYQMLREGPRDGLRLFRDMDAAIAWVDLTAERADVLDALARIRPLD
jgi:hypothetical protein